MRFLMGNTKSAVAYGANSNLVEAQEILDSTGASDWNAFEVDGVSGVYVEMKMPLSVFEFSRRLMAFGDDWILCKDPRA
jgi:hypothetical protein